MLYDTPGPRRLHRVWQSEFDTLESFLDSANYQFAPHVVIALDTIERYPVNLWAIALERSDLEPSDINTLEILERCRQSVEHGQDYAIRLVHDAARIRRINTYYIGIVDHWMRVIVRASEQAQTPLEWGIMGYAKCLPRWFESPPAKFKRIVAESKPLLPELVRGLAALDALRAECQYELEEHHKTDQKQGTRPTWQQRTAIVAGVVSTLGRTASIKRIIGHMREDGIGMKADTIRKILRELKQRGIYDGV